MRKSLQDPCANAAFVRPLFSLTSHARSPGGNSSVNRDKTSRVEWEVGGRHLGESTVGDIRKQPTGVSQTPVTTFRIAVVPEVGVEPTRF